MNPIGFQRFLVINLLDLTRQTLASLPLACLRLAKVSTSLWLSLVVLVCPCLCLCGRICLFLSVCVYVCCRRLHYRHSCDWRKMVSVLIYCIYSTIRAYACIYIYICTNHIKSQKHTLCMCNIIYMCM